MAAQVVTEEPIITREQAIAVGATPTVRLDWFGVLCSFGCAVHCAATPVLVATLPSLTSLRWLADPLFHQIVAILCGVLVSRAIVPGYRRHGDSRVVTLAGVGVGLLFVAAFILPDACCFDAAKLSAKDSESRGTKIMLVSSTNTTGSAKLGAFNIDESVSVGANESVSCPHVATFSRPLLTAGELEEQMGMNGARTLIKAQPYLSPIGGLFLIVAHIMNIRLRCCRRAPCRK